ncbi:MAG: Holliday junction branch migration protein RuvA [Acidobacteriota bacterium]|nr:Holliday junction branch migration protein RuvA [Acidobacteriota bacterium]
MIALLRGEVAGRGPDHVLLLCGGVGYRAAVSAETVRRVPAIGHQATLHTHLLAREDALVLYGFHTEAERGLFQMLIGVPAIGPKLALSILSAGPVGELLGAIAAGDSRRFQAAPGVGKRTAERLVAELREKVGAQLAPGALGPALSAVAARAGAPPEPRMLASDGLLELGYSTQEAEALLRESAGESVEELIAGALRAARAA